MSPSRFREFILGLIAFALGAGSLLVAGSALAEQPAEALFRIEQRWHGFPDPPVTAGGAGMYQGYLIPYTLDAIGKPGIYQSPPATARVAVGNPIGGPFTLPQSVFTSYWTDTLTPKTAWPGYTTTYWYHVYNGPGKFEPNAGPTTDYRVVFPTTGGNPSPTTFKYDPVIGRSRFFGGNYGSGNPVTPTTTFGGRYDVSRGGSLYVTPGPNRFGGTFQIFSRDSAYWLQFISYITPFFYEGYGSYFCFDDGAYGCTADTFVSEPGTTAIYKGIWWLLTEDGNTRHNKATTPTAPRQATYPTLTPDGNASYLRRSQHYLNLIHPFTTGYARAVLPGGNVGSGTITPMGTGYDINLGGATITVPKKNYRMEYIPSLMELVYSTTTPYTQVMKGVTRVVSMVRPRVTWTIVMPIDPINNAIENIWSPVRMKRLTVYFLPEPAGMLMLGVGSAALLGLFRMRRR